MDTPRLRELTAKNIIGPHDTVAIAGLDVWVPAREVPGLLNIPFALPADRASAGSAASLLPWLIVTSIPGIAVVAWFLAALIAQRGRYLLYSLLHGIWPVVFAVVAKPFLDTPFTDPDEQLVAAIVGGVILVAMLGASARLGWQEWNEWYPRLPASEDETSTRAVLERGTVPGGKSYFFAYVLWAVAGWLGLHRFYLGRVFSGCLYAFTLGLFGIGWLVDFLWTAAMVRQQRRRLIETVATDVPTYYGRQLAQVAPWTADGPPFGIMGTILRFLFFLVAPSFIVVYAYFWERYEFAILMGLVFAMCGLLGGIGSSLDTFRRVGKLPILSDGLEIVERLHQFYYNHRPGPFLYYLFFPLLWPLGFVFSRSGRREVMLLARVMVPVVVLAAADLGRQSSSLFRPYFDWPFIVGLIVGYSLAIGFISTLLFVPMITTTFTLSLSGMRRRMGVLVYVGAGTAILAAVGLGVAKWVYDRPIPTVATVLFEMKAEVPQFREDLGRSARMFFTDRRERGELPAPAPPGLYVEEELTAKFRRHLLNVITEKEAEQIVVFSCVPPSARTIGPRWFVVAMSFSMDELAFDSELLRAIFVIDSRGKFTDQWSEVPDEMRTLMLTPCHGEVGPEWLGRLPVKYRMAGPGLLSDGLPEPIKVPQRPKPVRPAKPSY